MEGSPETPSAPAAATDGATQEALTDLAEGTAEPVAPDQTAVSEQAYEPAVESAQPGPTVVPEPVVPEIMPAVDDGEPAITGIDVSYEAMTDAAAATRPEESPPAPDPLAPPLTEQASLSPPAPPLGSSVESPEELASFGTASAPPPPEPAETFAPAAAATEVESTPEPVLEPAGDAVKRFAIDRSATDDATAAATTEEPAVHIPPSRIDTHQVRRGIPKPIGAAPDLSLDRPLPRPIPRATPTTDEDATSAARPRVELPDRPKAAPAPDLDLPPIDGRAFQNPGLMGQGLQLALLASAAIAVAMIVGLIVLNNRLDAYATSGEQLNRVESAESIINSWMRPLLAAAVLLTYILFVVWVRRVVNNLSVFDRSIPETALWMWIIPVVNVYLLHQHMDRAWKGADVHSRYAQEWMRGRHELWNIAFAILVVAAFGLIIYAGFLDSATFEASMDANAQSMVGYGLLSASLLCAVKAVGHVIERQQARVASFD